MVLSIRPVFVGGPLHGQPVDFLVVELGRDFIAVDGSLEEITWRYDPNQNALVNQDAIALRQVLYRPHTFNLVNDHRDVSGELRIRDVFQLQVWVDNRLCETAKNRLMWDIIKANGWKTDVALCLGWAGPVTRATAISSGGEEVATVGQPEEPAPEQPER